MRKAFVLLALLAVAVPATARASVQQETTFQDDDLLVFADQQTQAQTLDTIKALGGDRLRISVYWNAIAPDAKSKTKPNFDASDPGAYPAINWARYDQWVSTWMPRPRIVHTFIGSDPMRKTPPGAGWTKRPSPVLQGQSAESATTTRTATYKSNV